VLDLFFDVKTNCLELHVLNSCCTSYGGLTILGREEGASGNSVESCHEIICCQIRVSQNVSRVPLSIFSTRFVV